MAKKINWIVFYLIIISFSICGSISAEIIDRIVAIVNSDIVTLVQLNREAGPYIKNIEAAGYTSEEKNAAIRDLNGKVLNALIEKSLTQQEAERYRISVPDAEIDNTIENIKQSKSLSQEDLEQSLASEGLSLDEYRDNLKNQILQSKLINHAVKSKVVITEDDIKKKYEEDAQKYQGIKKYHLRNILMTNESQVKEVKTKLDGKKKFTTLAKEYSKAPNAAEGGNLGLFDVNSFSQNIKESILKLKKREYTDVISTPQGFQIFYVQDIVSDGGKTYEQAHDEIGNKLYNIQVEKKFKTWLDSLKKKAAIKIML